MWIIKNIKYNIYYQSTIQKGMYHFVSDCEKAHKYKTRAEANKKIKEFKNRCNFELIKEV